jgi:hypothetical protein
VRPRLNGSVKLTIRAFHARLLPRYGIAVSQPRLDLGCMANTLPENNKRFLNKRSWEAS